MNTLELTDAIKQRNHNSHYWGIIDDCRRCLDCEIGFWNGWKSDCNNY